MFRPGHYHKWSEKYLPRPTEPAYFEPKGQYWARRHFEKVTSFKKKLPKIDVYILKSTKRFKICLVKLNTLKKKLNRFRITIIK